MANCRGSQLIKLSRVASELSRDVGDKLVITERWSDLLLKGATSRLVHLEKFSLNFSSSSFAIRVNLLHP